MKPVYVQTASFAKELTDDFDGSMRKIAGAGYDGVELFSGIYGGMTAPELRRYLGDLGLTAIGAHVYLERFAEQIDYLPALGARYIVCPGLHVHSYEEALRAAESLNEWGEKSRLAGLMAGYHNHFSDFEAYNGKAVIELLMENTDPALVTFELDTAWVCRAGQPAAAFINSHPGRFQLIHCKETSRALKNEENPASLAKAVKYVDGRPQFTPEQLARFREHHKTNVALGQGIIDMPAIIRAAEAQGHCFYIVERENAYTGDIFTSLANDFAYMQTL